MKVLLIGNYKPGVGGISGQVEILQRKLREEGHVAEVFSTKASVWRRLWMPVRLRNRAKAFDVLHIHCCSGWGFFPAVLGVGAGKRLGKRVVLTYHGGGAERFFRKHNGLVRHFLLKTDVNIVLSGFLGRVFDEHGLPYTVIPNIIELDETQFYKRKTLTPKYICTRAHEELYNIPCILRAYGIVKAEMPDATLTLVGDGSQHTALMQMAEDMGLEDVTFTGRVDNNMIYDYLNNADILVSSPTVDNMPVSLLEAMNAGLLIISSRVGGVPYMIEDGRTGLLFDDNDSATLAKLMLQTVRQLDESMGMIDRARHEVAAYRWENVRNKIYSAYGISA